MPKSCSRHGYPKIDPRRVPCTVQTLPGGRPTIQQPIFADGRVAG